MNMEYELLWMLYLREKGGHKMLRILDQSEIFSAASITSLPGSILGAEVSLAELCLAPRKGSCSRNAALANYNRNKLLQI